MSKLRTNAKGFTIIELMIATLVFSVVLLMCASALIAVGRMYQKGNTSRATQEVARSLMDQIKDDFQFNGGYYSEVPNPTNSPTRAFCIGGNVYTYEVNRQVVPGVTNHAMVVSSPPTGCPSVAENLDTTSSKELLGPRMRLLEPPITSVTKDSSGQVSSVSIKINVAAGADDLLSGFGCKGGAGQEFCANSVLVSYATRRLR
jgi:prepilin-type N-terminal cleavage/methylation domain-containing protein